MPATVRRVDIARATLQRELTGDRGLVTRHVRRVVRTIRNRAVLLVPVDTGNLRASITWAVSSPIGGGGLVIEGRVGTPVEYGYTVHEGHPPMSVTVPAHDVRAHVRKGGVRVKAHTRSQHWRTLKGRTGRPFLRRAMEEVMARE